jgi:hypothetical protein
MKQNITKQQWEELSYEQKKTLTDWIGYIATNIEIDFTIGQMIEFLGEDLECMEKYEGKWLVIIKYHAFAKQTEWHLKELCDALFEAVRYKLKQP